MSKNDFLKKELATRRTTSWSERTLYRGTLFLRILLALRRVFVPSRRNNCNSVPVLFFQSLSNHLWKVCRMQVGKKFKKMGKFIECKFEKCLPRSLDSDPQARSRAVGRVHYPQWEGIPRPSLAGHYPRVFDRGGVLPRKRRAFTHHLGTHFKVIFTL